MQCIVLAGGRGTRLGGHFGDLPKHLVPVLGRPFADYQLNWLRREGFDHIIYGLGYGAKQVEDHIRYLNPAGLKFTFVRDGDEPLGTGGSLRRIYEDVRLDEYVGVTYGDTLLTFDMQAFLSEVRLHRPECMMTVWKNCDQLNRSNASLTGEFVSEYSKSNSAGRFEWIDYGFIIVKSALLREIGPLGGYSDFSDSLASLASEKRIRGFEVLSRFYEIGNLGALSDTETFLDSEIGRNKWVPI